MSRINTALNPVTRALLSAHLLAPPTPGMYVFSIKYKRTGVSKAFAGQDFLK